jgi:membrane-bound serine protease (ClpP class)
MAGYARKTNSILSLLLIFCLLFSPGAMAEPVSPIYVLQVEGPIVPVIGEYIREGVAAAEKQGASLVIIELSTPGGLEGELSETQKQKAAEDAAAWIRSIAETRGRDPVSAEAAVLESKSFSDKEALELGLIDLHASSREDLINQIQGKNITLIGGQEISLDVVGKPIQELEMGAIQRLLFGVSEPNIAYLLMTVGTLGIILELYHPGAIFPGVVGGISLLLGLYALGSLNAQLSGILLLLLGLGLLAGEVFASSHGLLATGGLVSFTLGSFMLFSKANPPFLRVSITLIVTTALLLAAAIVLLLRAVIRAQRRQAFSGKESLPGKRGVALTAINPSGTVLFEGERWQAESSEPLEAGEKVLVTGMEGLVLRVKKWPEEQPPQ